LTAEPILRTRHLTRAFSGFVAVDAVDFHVQPGEVRAIIGPNGAGKTTFFRLLSGDLPPSEGQIWFQGGEVSRLPAHRRSRLGVGRSYQIANSFQNLTVFENVRISAQPPSLDYRIWASYGRDSALDAKTASIIESVGLTDKQERLASHLSYGDRRRLELGMALGNDPSLLLLDEPTAGMTPGETDATVELIRQIARGRTVILVEHKIKVVMTVCDRVTTFHQGKILAEGTPAEIRAHRGVQSVYFGHR
jgi:branched-chain amino acid transport system ATP-binding protein